MRALAIAFVAALLCSGLAVATDITSEWAGVYKTRFQNGNNWGDRYESENVLEIVRLDAESAYVRTRLEFANGHRCALYVVARVEGESLVYRERDPPAYRDQCVLSLTRVGEILRFSDQDERVCRLELCGARGYFEGAAFPVSARRRIRYMDRLLASREYAEAMAGAGRPLTTQ